MKKIILLVIAIIMLTGCDEYSNNSENNTTHKGRCVEYGTEYRLDCGIFTCSDSFCCERKYEVCKRWEE